MILTTTNSIEGGKITDYKGIVTGVCIKVTKIKMTFNMDKYYQAREERINEVKEIAFQKLKENAKKMKANAVVGIKLDMELNAENSVNISLIGTAVWVEL